MLPERIAAEARTVVQIAAHFRELQTAGDRLLSEFTASRRGYFTPSEDEEVRHLLVSYRQGRNALIELVFSFRDDSALMRESRPQAFLVAFAGALVLIDAARYLRERFHDRPIVRQKLNEPEPHFGIPEGTYDLVQASLTSPVHAWHLYHAVQYFDQNQKELRAAAREEPLSGVMDVIDRLQDRLQVDVRDYTTARIRVRTRQAWTTLKRDLLGRALYGLQKVVSRLVSDVYTMPHHHPCLPDGVAADLRDVLRPGDVLITRKEHALTNYFLPGYWPHAALYLGGGDDLVRLGIAEHANLKPRWLRLLECDKLEQRRVLEAMKDGVWIRSLSSPFCSDAIAAVRPRLSESSIAEAIGRGMFHEGKPYDFDFDFTRSDRLVCTEVVYRSYEGVSNVRFQLTRRAGRMTLAAEDLIRMALNRDHFEPLACYCPGHNQRLLLGDEAESVMRRTHVPTA